MSEPATLQEVAVTIWDILRSQGCICGALVGFDLGELQVMVEHDDECPAVTDCDVCSNE